MNHENYERIKALAGKFFNPHKLDGLAEWICGKPWFSQCDDQDAKKLIRYLEAYEQHEAALKAERKRIAGDKAEANRAAARAARATAGY